MTLVDFIDYCAEMNVDGTELTSYYFPKDVTSDYLNQLKEMSFRLGLDISGTAIGNNFCVPEGESRKQQLADTRKWIDYAAQLGAPVIRIFAGTVPKGDSEEAAIERCISAIDESVEYASRKGVMLALENHGGITATPDQILKIVQQVKSSPWFGVNLDSGNFHSSDPYRDLERIAPYSVNAQIKVTMKSGDGRKTPADLARIVQILKDVKYRGYVVLEYEEADPRGEIPHYLQQLRELIS
jgi:sugar phosphate isomerase/epimerase